MDKNMIKIDDLLRQRLGDAEEQDRPAAWMQMRDLLDKQMPVNRVVGGATNWRRMFAYVAGLALLAAVSVGGYEMAQSFSTNNSIPDNGIAANTSAPVTTGLAGSAINSLPDTRLEAAAAAQPAPATDAAGTLATTNSATKGQQSTTNTIGQKEAVASENKNNKSLNTNSLEEVNSSNTTNKQSTKPAGMASVTEAVASSNTSGNRVANTAKTSPVSQVNNTAANNRTSSNTSGKTATNSNNNQQPAANDPLKNVASSGKVSGAKDAAGSLPTGQLETAKSSGSEPTLKEIPYKKIERKGKEGVAKMDTIFNGEDVMKVAVPDKNELLAKNNTEENSGSNIMPASAAQAEKKESSSEEVVMNKLGDHKVSSKKMKNFHPGRFEEMVKNAKFRMGAVKFYPGVVGGANIAFNGNVGWHLGLAGNLKISDRWAILTEVKYAYTFNNSKEKMQDDFIENVKPANINGQAVWTYDSMEHYYNFTNYANLDVPLLATYTHNQFVFMAGGNFRYNFKINNAEEVQQRYLLEQSYTTTSSQVFATDKKILLSDFSPSMNIAPMIGFGYIYSPAIRLDCRLSKSVWNNASSYGQKEISKSLYNMPQFQVNIHYRFISNRPYKRAR